MYLQLSRQLWMILSLFGDNLGDKRTFLIQNKKYSSKSFRDPDNGFWCDTLRLENFIPCGAQNNFYSSAGTGMGLVSEAIMVELGQSQRYEEMHLKNSKYCCGFQVTRQERKPSSM